MLQMRMIAYFIYMCMYVCMCVYVYCVLCCVLCVVCCVLCGVWCVLCVVLCVVCVCVCVCVCVRVYESCESLCIVINGGGAKSPDSVHEAQLFKEGARKPRFEPTVTTNLILGTQCFTARPDLFSFHPTNSMPYC